VGLWAAFVLVRSAEAPDTPAGWVTGTGTVVGWSVFVAVEADPLRPQPPWSGVRGPMLTAVVQSSDVALLAAWNGGRESFRCLFPVGSAPSFGPGGRTEEEPDEEAEAAERAAVIPVMLAWADAAGLAGVDAGRLDGVLSRFYTFAEEGLFGFLEELGVLERGRGVDWDDPLPGESTGESTGEAPADGPVPVPPVLAGVAAGDAAVLPDRPRVMFLAAEIDYSGLGWDAFVIWNELEAWGRPGCLVAESVTEVPAGGLARYERWWIHLGSDPAITVFEFDAPLAAASEAPLGILPVGAWQVVPAEHAEVTAAIGWARANVGTCREPVAAGREPVQTELAEKELDNDPRTPSPMARASEPRLVGALYTYLDLTQRADVLAEWLAQARRVLIDPTVAACGDLVSFPSGGNAGAPYACAVSIESVSFKGRSLRTGGEESRWKRALVRLRAGELQHLALRLDRLDGRGYGSRYRPGIEIEVEMYRSFEPNAPLHHQRPATVTISVAKRFLGDGGLDVVRDLVRSAATALDAVTGYLHGWGNVRGSRFVHSPFEQRHHAEWQGEPLDSTTRGVHWANLVGAGHLDAIGGLDRLEQLRADGRITRIEQWATEPQLWWYEITTDPFGPCHDRADTLVEPLAAITPTRGTPPWKP
jgi:hypothetical protein